MLVVFEEPDNLRSAKQPHIEIGICHTDSVTCLESPDITHWDLDFCKSQESVHTIFQHVPF